MRKLIAYQNILVAEPVEEDTVQVKDGRNSLFLAPEDLDAFFRYLTQRLSLSG